VALGLAEGREEEEEGAFPEEPEPELEPESDAPSQTAGPGTLKVEGSSRYTLNFAKSPVGE
jgi:hypothetical protein